MTHLVHLKSCLTDKGRQFLGSGAAAEFHGVIPTPIVEIEFRSPREHRELDFEQRFWRQPAIVGVDGTLS